MKKRPCSQYTSKMETRHFEEKITFFELTALESSCESCGFAPGFFNKIHWLSKPLAVGYTILFTMVTDKSFGVLWHHLDHWILSLWTHKSVFTRNVIMLHKLFLLLSYRFDHHYRMPPVLLGYWMNLYIKSGTGSSYFSLMILNQASCIFYQGVYYFRFCHYHKCIKWF